jgi:hypothetical protein
MHLDDRHAVNLGFVFYWLPFTAAGMNRHLRRLPLYIIVIFFHLRGHYVSVTLSVLQKQTKCV